MSSEPDSWWAMWGSLRAGELAAFERHDATISVIHDSYGLLILEVGWPVPDREPMRLRVGFSTLHPFCRPDVSAPDETLARHQNPLTKGLCLLTQSPGQWNGSELVADMIARQLRQLLDVLDARRQGNMEKAAVGEETFADPLSVYFNALSEKYSTAYFGRDNLVPAGCAGRGEARWSKRPVQVAPGVDAVEIVLERLLPFKGAWFGAKFELPQQVGEWKTLPVRWVKADPSGCSTPDELLARAEEAAASSGGLLGPALEQWSAIGRSELALTILVIDDEADYRTGARRPGFIFLLCRRSRKRRSVSFIRSYGIAADIFDRLPVRTALNDKVALVIGCGAIGSFVAMELARAGFREITLVDPDILEPGNYVRWAAGRPFWGIYKAEGLAALIRQNYPWTVTNAATVRIGAAASDVDKLKGMTENPFTALRDLVRSADVVIDTSAATECQRAMAFLCRRERTALVIGNATPGAVGGMVAQFRADAEACFNCAQEQWVEAGLPNPPEDKDGMLVPVGCNMETFTGGSYDLQEVSLQVVRSAIGMVAPEIFDAGKWDVAALSLFEDGKRVLPSWRTGIVEPRLSCCAKAAAA